MSGSRLSWGKNGLVQRTLPGLSAPRKVTCSTVMSSFLTSKKQTHNEAEVGDIIQL
jgi:hypothetical protein